MQPRQLKDGVWSVGAVDWDTRLFDSLIPLPNGTSYNAYLVRGSEKTVLLDTVDPRKTQVLLNNLQKLQVEHIDYVVAHHAEQDHSGSLPAVLERFPAARVLTNEKCKSLLRSLLHIPDNRFQVVENREVISIGDGATLQFILAPWVHWPETMFTYLKEAKLLFTCDFLGSHFATSDLIISDMREVYGPAKRYYAEIMMPFRTRVRKNLDLIAGLSVDMVAPSHGPIYEKPQLIVDAYREWSSDEVNREVVLAYVSMHGSTKMMAEALVDGLVRREVKVRVFDLTVTDIGELAMALVDAAAMVIATPTVLAGPHPQALYAAYLANALRPKARHVGVVVSYAWGGKAVEILKDALSNFRSQLIDPVLVQGQPESDDFRALEGLADTLAKQLDAL